MARKRKKRPVTARNRAFGAASRTCLPLSNTWKEFGRCMRGELKGRKRKK